jgi:hypothetical protein
VRALIAQMGALLVALVSRIPVRELLLAAVLAMAGYLVVGGVAMWSEATAKIVAGVLVAVGGVLFLAEVGD